MVATIRHARHQHKRHGRHQKQTRHFMKVYWPYLPLLIIVGTGLLFSAYWQPRTRSGVLPYATSMSTNDLLQSTNSHRSSNGKTALTLSSQLNQAAQAKANDMTARDYWSHNTPEGNPPWVFIDQTGYDYKKAGENLAYGFMTSSDTVAGWMNSQSHRDNMLDSAYQQVGFGFANSPNYQSSGEQTVVVAMYGEPAVLASAAAPAPTSTQAAPKASTPASKPVSQEPTPEPAPQAVAEAAPVEEEPVAAPVTSENNSVLEPPSRAISRVQAFTNGTQPWLASTLSMITVASVGVLFIKHGLAMRRFIARGERYVLHHTLFDITIIGLIGLVFVLTRTAGVIR